jgi:hypothetical protein
MTATLYLGPAVVHLSGVRAGDRNSFHVMITQQGTPVDLTGQTARAQVRAKATDEDPATEAVIQVVNAAGGHLLLSWPGAGIRTLLAGKATFKGVWDLQLAAGAADPQTVVAGTFAAEMDVTR